MVARASSSARCVGWWSSRRRDGERAEPAVGHLVADQPAGQGGGVDLGRRQLRLTCPPARGAQEREVEPHVVADEHRRPGEVEQRGEHGLDARRRGDDGIGEAGEQRDPGRDRAARVDERLERAEALAAAHLDRTDLGDHVVVAVPARGLEIEDAERRRRRAACRIDDQVVEAALLRSIPSVPARCHDTTNTRSRQEHAYDRRPVRDRVLNVAAVRHPRPRRRSSTAGCARRSSSRWRWPRRGRRSPAARVPGRAASRTSSQPRSRRGARALRRAIEADDTFRRRLAAGALPELVDPIGIEWLRREDGWEQRSRGSSSEADVDASEPTPSSALRRAEKRREAAEQAAAAQPRRARRVALQDRGAAAAARRAAGAPATRRSTVAGRPRSCWRRRRLPNATPTIGPRRHGLASLPWRRRARGRPGTGQRGDESARRVLADRAERAGVGLAATRSPSCAPGAVGASSRRSVERPRRRRRARPRRASSPLPGGVVRDSLTAAEHLLRRRARSVVVDGYNVAKLGVARRRAGWPAGVVPSTSIEKLARRFGSDITVVFDGADVVGRPRRAPSAGPGRLLAGRRDRRRRHPRRGRRDACRRGPSSWSPTIRPCGAPCAAGGANIMSQRRSSWRLARR